jgi:hypothetical protein
MQSRPATAGQGARGTWWVPAVLLSVGLGDFQKQLGTRIRNGITIREHGVPAELHADRASQCPSRC